MAPEYGATMGFFPVDEKTLAYFKGTGRSKSEIEAFEAYFKAKSMAYRRDTDYSQVVRLPSRSRPACYPKRPQDRIAWAEAAVQRPVPASRGRKTASTTAGRRPMPSPAAAIPAQGGARATPWRRARRGRDGGNRPALAAAQAAPARQAARWR